MIQSITKLRFVMVSAEEVTSKEELDDLLREQNSSLLRKVLVSTVSRKMEVSKVFASEEAHLKDDTPECPVTIFHILLCGCMTETHPDVVVTVTTVSHDGCNHDDTHDCRLRFSWPVMK